MVPRDLFNKMSALALLSILLLGAMSIRRLRQKSRRRSTRPRKR